MNALLVYPAYPDTFMGFRHALRFIRRKAAMPPLGLLTVAAMMPSAWNKKVVDLNVNEISGEDLDWADVVFVSAMIIQQKSAKKVIDLCRTHEKIIVAGGPLFSHLPEMFEGVDHVVIGEAEEIMPRFLADFQAGKATGIYRTEAKPDMSLSPVPQWELLNMNDYRTMSVQSCRGCPFDCEFCDIVNLFGRTPRFKSPEQITAELDSIYAQGWRSEVMFVDDNFIGHRRKVKELLRAVIDWQKAHRYPFNFNTQASVDLAKDPELMRLMVEANMDSVFLGLETPASESLAECNKRQNQVDLLEAVQTIQAHGLSVSGGFIIGFDADPPSIFDDQVNFIEKAGIPNAMVGLLSVGPGTKLHTRLENEGRMLGLPSGDNAMDAEALNFVPRMDRQKLLTGYRSVLRRLYEPGAYYERVWGFLKRHGRELNGVRRPGKRRLSWEELKAGARIIWRLGFKEYGRRRFWAFLFKVWFTKPKRLPTAISMAALGYHFRVVTDRFLGAPASAARV